MKGKSILRSGVLFLVIALLIGSISFITLAQNNVARGGLGGGIQRNQSQLQECDCDGDCDGEHDGNQPVKVSGVELRAMKIADIAKLWEIDTTSLLNEIVHTFNLKKTYTIENTIDDLRGEYRFPPFQIKNIADKLKSS